MTLEQPASFNRYIEEFQELTWSTRLELFKLLQPISVFMGILGLEKVGLQVWNGAEHSIWSIAALFLTPVWLPMIVLVGNEIQLKIQRQSKRLLKVSDKGIPIGRFERPVIPWSKILAFNFEQIPNAPQFCKLNIQCLPQKRLRNSNQKLMLGNPTKIIILEKPTQVEALVSELKLLKQKHNLKFSIELDYVSPPPKEPRYAILGASLSFAGLFFLLNAMPILVVGFSQSNDEAHLHPKTMQHEAFAKFLRSHFSSVTEFKHFLIACGSVLVVVGIALIISAFVIQRQKTLGAD
jgi:hypothetical protein